MALFKSNEQAIKTEPQDSIKEEYSATIVSKGEIWGDSNSDRKEATSIADDCERIWEGEDSNFAVPLLATPDPVEDQENYYVKAEELEELTTVDDVKSAVEPTSNTEGDDGSKCKICKKDFGNTEGLDHHMKGTIVDKTFTCCACGKQFRDTSQLNVHIRKHTGEQPYECKQCGKKFSINGNLSKHLRTHTGERRFKCDVCNRKFTQFAHLEDHVKTHSGMKPFQCDVCMSAFKTKARLRKHIKCHQEENATKRSVRCPICNLVMKTMRQFIDHVKVHGDAADEPYNCGVCGKNYKTLLYLQNHQKLHDGVRRYQCTICHKAFTTSSQLRRHINSHAGLKPFTCELCQRSFPSTQNLKRHMLTHTGIKPYSCDVCAKGFLSVENLNRHMRIHTGEKPYPCDICGKSFAHSTTVKEHRRLHTGDRPFACTFCTNTFTANKLLFKHMRQKHPGEYENFKRQNSEMPNTLNRTMDRDFSTPLPVAAFQTEYVEVKGLVKGEFEPVGVKKEPDDGSRPEDATGSQALDPAGVPVKNEIIDEYGPFNCVRCDQKFTTTTELKKHIASTCNLRHTCDICNRGLSTPAKLRRHMKLHAKAKDSADVKWHKTNAAKLECTVCGRSFGSEQTLSGHMATHTKEEMADRGNSAIAKAEAGDLEADTTCNVCSATFENVYLLHDHKLDHICDSPFKCGLCGEKFSTADMLFLHSKERHTSCFGLVISQDGGGGSGGNISLLPGLQTKPEAMDTSG